MAVAGWSLHLAVGIAVIATADAQADDRFRGRPLLPRHEDGLAPRPESARDYDQYDYDYYDDAQPRPPSRLDRILPLVKFQCHAEGYFADPEFNCEVYHYCSASGTRFTFLCGEGSQFQQKTLICDFNHNLRCGENDSSQKTPAHADTLSIEHLLPAGEIMKKGVTKSSAESSRHHSRPAAGSERRRRPEGRPQLIPRPLPARRRQDTQPASTERQSHSEQDQRRPAQEAARRPDRPRARQPAAELPRRATRPLDRYQAAGPPPPPVRRAGTEDGYQAVLNDIHGIIRETEAFQLPVLPLLTPAQRRQDESTADPGQHSEPPPRMHVPKRRDSSGPSRRRDPYGPTPLRRPTHRRRQRSVVWEDHGLLALRDIVDSKVSKFFPQSDAPTAERRSDSSVTQKERAFDAEFFSDLRSFGASRFSASAWPSPVGNEISAETERTGQTSRRGRTSAGSRSAWAQPGTDSQVYGAAELASTDFGYKRGRSEDASEVGGLDNKPMVPSGADPDEHGGDVAVTESPQESATEAVTELETAATTEVFDAAEYGTPKSSSILPAGETAELAEPAVAASTQVAARRRPRRQQLQRRQFVPRNEGVDQLRQLQRQTPVNRPVFSAPQPGRPFLNTQFVNVGPSVGRLPARPAGQDRPQPAATGDLPARQADFGGAQRFQPGDSFSFQPIQPTFRRPVNLGSATSARQAGFRAIGSQPAEQGFGPSQQRTSFPQSQSFSRPVFQDSQRFGAPQPPSVVTVGSLPTSFRQGSTSFGSRPESSTSFGSISTSNTNLGSGPDPTRPDGRPGSAIGPSAGQRFPLSPGPQFQRPAAVQFGRPAGSQRPQQAFRSGGLLPAPNALGFNTFVAPQFAAAFQRLPPPPSPDQSVSEPASGPARFIPTRPPSQFRSTPTAAPFAFSPRPTAAPGLPPRTAAPTVPQTTFPAFDGGDAGRLPAFKEAETTSPRSESPVVSLRPFDEEFFSGVTGRPLAEVPQSLSDDLPPLETIAPAPHISTPLPEGVLTTLAGVTEPTTALQAEPTEPAATEPPRAAAAPGKGRRRFRTRRPGRRRRPRPRPTAAAEVTDVSINQLAPNSETVKKDSGFTIPVEEVTGPPQTDSSVAPQRTRRPSRHRLSGRRRTTTTTTTTSATTTAAAAATTATTTPAPGPTEPTKTTTGVTEATEPVTSVRAVRRRRPTGRGNFRSRPRTRKRLRARVHQQTTSEDAETEAGASRGESLSGAAPARDVTDDSQPTKGEEEEEGKGEEEVTPRPRRRRPQGASSGPRSRSRSRSRRPIRRRNRVRTTAAPSTQSPVTEPQQTEEKVTTPSPPQSDGEPAPEQGIRATAAELRLMQEQEATAGSVAEGRQDQTPVKTTQQRLQELFERRRKNRLSFRRQRPTRRRRPASDENSDDVAVTATTAAADQVEREAPDARSVDAPEDAPQHRIGGRRLTQPRLRMRVSRPAGGDAKVTVQRAETPSEPSRQPAEEPTEERPARRRFRPGRVRSRQRTRIPLRTGGRVSTLASLLVETSGPSTTPVPATTTAAASEPTTAEPTNAESLVAVNLEGSNMEGRGDPPKRTLLGSVRLRDSPVDPVTRTTITPVLAETENPAPRATRPTEPAVASLGAGRPPTDRRTDTATTAGRATAETTVRTTPETMARTTAETTVRTTAETMVRTTPKTTVRTTAETTVRTTPKTMVRTTAETTVRTTPKTTVWTTAETTVRPPSVTAEPQTTTEGAQRGAVSNTEQPEFIPFDNTGSDVSLDSIVEQVAATEAPTNHPSITMATDAPLLPLQSLFEGF